MRCSAPISTSRPSATSAARAASATASPWTISIPTPCPRCSGRARPATASASPATPARTPRNSRAAWAWRTWWVPRSAGASPSPILAFFRRLIAEAGCPPDQIVYVGDRVDNDVLPALAAGLQAIHIARGPWGVVQARWPEAEGLRRIRSLAELPALLASISPDCCFSISFGRSNVRDTARCCDPHHRSPIGNHRRLDHRRLNAVVWTHADFDPDRCRRPGGGLFVLLAVPVRASDRARAARHRFAGVGARRRARRSVTANGILGSAAFGPMSIPFGVFLMVAAGIAGLLVYQAPKSGAPR